MARPRAPARRDAGAPTSASGARSPPPSAPRRSARQISQASSSGNDAHAYTRPKKREEDSGASIDESTQPPARKRQRRAAPNRLTPAQASNDGPQGAGAGDADAGSQGAAGLAQKGGDGGDRPRHYWLMKAEPESRLENGVDVKFSIDDLARRTAPEPWDGIRNYAARNNLRAMASRDLAFFYHSNCKEPSIVGTMEIVREHSPDLSAHDPKAPYYDPKSKPSDPRWSVVHVKFRSKFARPITLKELREMGAPGKPLEKMQLLKMSRLSVSAVTEAEWDYLMGVAAERAGQDGGEDSGEDSGEM